MCSLDVDFPAEIPTKQKMSMKVDQKLTPERLMQFGSVYAPPFIIGAAVSNRALDTLAKEAKTVEEVGKATGASPRGLRAKLDDIVRTGEPAEARNEEHPWTEFFTELVENIIPTSYSSAQALADHLKLAAAKQPIRVLDVAAGSGIWGIALAQKSPQVQVTAVDWAGMIPTTRRITQKFGVGDRFKFIEGDIGEADFGSGYDIATLGHILHSEGKERSRHLLKKTFGTLKAGGTIAIGDWLVNDERTEPLPSLIFSVTMLINIKEGDTFSFHEIKSWLEEAGFKNARTLEAPGPSPLIVATKP